MGQPGRFLTAEWRNLIMVNYEMEPGLLRPHVPQGTEPDTWNGRTYASLVGFHFLRTRVLGIPIPFHVNFEEVNLRFYVRHKSGNEWRRGVVFIKEIVPRWAIAFVARTLYNEKYMSHRMGHELRAAPGSLHASYSWHSGNGWNRIEVDTNGEFQPMTPGSEAEFIAEHYWGYSAQPDGGTVEYRVEHPPWRVCAAERIAVECDIAGMYGAQFEPALRAAPASAFLADGSAVAVYRGTRLPRR